MEWSRHFYIHMSCYVVGNHGFVSRLLSRYTFKYLNEMAIATNTHTAAAATVVHTLFVAEICRFAFGFNFLCQNERFGGDIRTN